MKNPNLIAVVVIVLIITAVACLPVFLPQKRTIEADAPAVAVTAAATAAPQATQAPTEQPADETQAPTEQTAADAQATEIPEVKAYLIITVQGNIYEPLPLTGEGTFTMRQDENTYNTVHITPSSMWMEHSSCDNQDCVEQGVVSLENMTERVLYNMVICLPNQVSLELHTPETLMDAFGLAQ